MIFDSPSSSGSALPVADTTALVAGSADATKQVRLSAGGLTTGTTRVLTVPDGDGTLALLERAQTWTEDQSIAEGKVIEWTSRGLILRAESNFALTLGAAGGSGKSDLLCGNVKLDANLYGPAFCAVLGAVGINILSDLPLRWFDGTYAVDGLGTPAYGLVPASGALKVTDGATGFGQLDARARNWTVATLPTPGTGTKGRGAWVTDAGKPAWDNGTAWAYADGAAV